IFSARSHAEHRDRRRKVVGAALTSSHVRAYSPVVQKHVQHFLSALPPSQANIAEPVHALTFNTLAEIIYGPSISPQPWTDTASGEGILEAFRGMSKFAWGGSHVPFLGWLFSTKPMVAMTRKPTFNAAGIPTGVGALATRAKVLLLEDQSLVTDVEQPSIAKSMLAIEKGDSRHMDNDELFRECFNLLFAGPGSTAAAITGVLERLGTKEGAVWQDRIRAELAEGKDASESKVLDAVIRESMRYSTPFPTAFPRDITPGAESAIAGISTPLPVGTLVGSDSWVVSHDVGTWGTNAKAWMPERWLEGERKENEDKFLVFSKGPRGCIGRDIAMLITTQAVAGVVSRWKFESSGIKGGGWLEMQVQECGLKLTPV
ncbi:Cytochrome P450 monooxygenase yanH, partial [Lachnellula suecica]